MDKPTPPSTSRAQSTISSFFKPRQQPIYAPPPNSTATLPTSTLPAVPQIPTSKPAILQPSKSLRPVQDLPEEASILPIQASHITALRRINSLLLPIAYPDAFYHSVLQPSPPSGQNFSRIILWGETVVGGLVCRLDPSLSPSSAPPTPTYSPDTHDIYIQSLVLLSPYRGKGLVTKALENVVEAAVEQKEAKIGSVYAHVWTENNEALEWYSARGFKVEGGVISGYYRRLKPDTALILRKRLSVTDHLILPPPTTPLPPSIPSPMNLPVPPNTPATLSPTRTPSDNSTLAQRAVSSPFPRPNITHARSFQEKGPDREWNDLPEDVLGNGLLRPTAMGSQTGSNASSRSSSRSGLESKGKKKRVYPAAAFGS